MGCSKTTASLNLGHLRAALKVDPRCREAHDGQKGGARFVPYERMKFEMMTDCALRALGRHAFALVLDVILGAPRDTHAAARSQMPP